MVARPDPLSSERAANDRLASSYFRIWDEYPIQRFTNDVESAWLREFVPGGSRVLVLGSGGGREIEALLAARCRVTAVDISARMIEAGRQRYATADIEWIEADLHELPTRLDGYDAAVCLGAVANYLQHPSRVLDHARRALSSGGLLVVSSINAAHPSERNTVQVAADGRVRRLFTVDELGELLTRSSFRVRTTRGIRFLVDLLPAAWNSDPVSNEAGARVLVSLLEQERAMLGLLPPEKAKFVWHVADVV